MTRSVSTTRAASVYQGRVDAADWAGIAAGLADLGCAVRPRLLTAADAGKLIGRYDSDEVFLSTITMGRHRFREGEYRYLADPLPDAVDKLPHALYPHLLPVIGGHRGTKIFGRLDCSTALRTIAGGGYVNHRVFFSDPDTAARAGYRPCAICMPAAYQIWKAHPAGRRPAAAPPDGGRGA